MWYVFVLNGQAYTPTQEEPGPVSTGRWWEFESEQEAWDFFTEKNNGIHIDDDEGHQGLRGDQGTIK